MGQLVLRYANRWLKMPEELRARCAFNAALAKIRESAWLVFVLEDNCDHPYKTASYNTLPKRFAAGIIQNQHIRKAAGMDI